MKKALIICVIIAALSVLAACSSSATATQTTASIVSKTASVSSQPTASVTANPTPQYGGILKIAVTNPSNYFGYNGNMYSAGAKEVAMPCLENLVRLDARGQLDPSGLVTDYQVNQDLTTVVFTLRQGVKFHDGTDFNAEAAKWVLDQGKKVRLQGTELFTSVEVVDDYNVKVNVKHFDSRVLQAVGDSQVSSPAAFDKYGKDQINTHPVGTGPFKFVSFTPDIGVTWERFDDYWGGKSYLDGIKTFFIVDDMARSTALQSGDVDIVFNVTTETALGLRAKGYTVAPGNMSVFSALWPDSVNESSPLSKLQVRQAIEYAIDREELAKLGSGFWQANNQPSEPTSPGYIPEFEGRQYDVNKANELLVQAGYNNGFDITIIYDQAKGLQDSMVSVQQMLSKIGINVDLQPVTNNVRTNYQKDGWQNGFIVQQVFCGPSQYLSALNYCLGGDLFIDTDRPPGWKEALNEAFYADPGGLDAACRKLNTLLYDNATMIPLYITPQVIYAMPDYVHDAHIYETANVWRWAPEKTWLSN